MQKNFFYMIIYKHYEIIKTSQKKKPKHWGATLLAKYSILVFSLFFFSCGKSPLLKKAQVEASGQYGYEVNTKTFKNLNLNSEIKFLSPINSNEVGHILVLTKNGNYSSSPNYFLHAFLWMPTMGHGSSPITVTKLSEGVYDLSEIYFIMDGFWQLHLQFKDGSKIIDEVIYDINI